MSVFLLVSACTSLAMASGYVIGRAHETGLRADREMPGFVAGFRKASLALDLEPHEWARLS